MKRLIWMAVAALPWAAPLQAQTATTPSLQPLDPARWDLSGEVGWLSSNRSEIGPDWDDWSDIVTGGPAVGYYWTPNLRHEVRLAFSGRARVYEEQQVVIPGTPFPYFRLREHLFRTTTVGSGLSYQFFENQWFHPSIGGGVDLVRETEHVFSPEQRLPSRTPGGQTVLPATDEPRTTRWLAQPFVSAGFKWYANERAFVRSGVRVSFGEPGVSHVTWTAGIGVDL